MMINKKLSNQERLLESFRTLSVKLDEEVMLQSVISLACELTDSEVASLLGYDDDGESLYFIAAPWSQRDSKQGIHVPLEGSIAGWVYKYSETLVIQNVKEDKRFYSKVDKAINFQTHSILAVPLLVKGYPVGVLEVINKRKRANYNGEDALNLETLASYVALIIKNMKLEELAVEMKTEADRLEQMKKDFIAIASHELRTPLGLILGHSTFLREIVAEEHHEQLDTIISNGAKLKEIIESLSNVDNFESGAARIRMKKFSLSSLIRKLAISFEKRAQEKEIELYTEIKESNLLIEGDAEKVGIAVANLLKNAITFTPEGGHVFIVVKQIPGYAKLSVIDDGIGIPTKDLAHIFERFYQVESHLTRKYGGMGLGLSVAKVMVELHGGKIWAESIHGKGSQISFLLPLDKDQASAAEHLIF